MFIGEEYSTVYEEQIVTVAPKEFATAGQGAVAISSCIYKK